MAQLVSALPLDSDAEVIDAPSGDGVITYWLIRQGLQRRFQLIDIAPSKTRHAEKLSVWAERRGVPVDVHTADLADIPSPPAANDVWLLVNSLFMLDRAHEIVHLMRPRTRYVIGVFPVTSHPDYQRYAASHPDVNVHEMDELETSTFFEEHGYELRSRRDITYIPTRAIRPDIARQALRLLITPLERLVPKRSPLYWIGVFERNDSTLVHELPDACKAPAARRACEVDLRE